MSTTTEAGRARRGHAVRLVALAVVVVVTWLIAILGITLVAEPTREVVILAPAGVVAHAPERAQVALADAPGGWLRVRGLSPGYVRELYAAGAWMVLPARSGTCGSGAAGVAQARISQASAE